MAPPTRLNPFRTPSPEPLAGKEATTCRKARYFNTLAHYSGSRSRRAIADECGISEGTARYWEKQRNQLGSLVQRRTRPRSAILSAKSKVTKEMYQVLVSLTRNPVRKEPYKAQIVYHNLPIGKR